MRSIVALVCLLLVLTATVAGAVTYPATQLTNTQDPTKWIDVVVSATFNAVPNTWTWTYACTPTNVNGVRSFNITLGAPEAGMVTNVTGPTQSNVAVPNWTSGTTSLTVYWDNAFPETPSNLDAGETFVFGFDHPWGPVENHFAAAKDSYGFTGDVYGPQPPPIPEPMTALLGVMGLGSVAGFRRLRKS